MAGQTLRYRSNAKVNHLPFNTPLYLLKPVTTQIKGSVKKTYPEQGELIFCSFRTFGGTEKVVNDIIAVENTAVVDTWYRPDITSDCILQTENGERYEIMGTPENLSMRNQYLRFKIRALKGGA